MIGAHEVGLEFVANAATRRGRQSASLRGVNGACRQQALASESLFAMLSNALDEARGEQGDQRRARATILAACQAAMAEGVESSLDVMAAGGGALLLGVSLAVLERGEGDNSDQGEHKLRMLEAALVVAEGMGLGGWKPEVVRDAAPY